MRIALPLAAFVALLSSAASARADDVAFFENKIRPVLAEHCYGCHSTASKKQRGGLLLDSRAGLRAGGDSGPALVPGQPDKSLLIKAVRYAHEELRMPPKGKLPDAVIANLEQWVKLGAPDPRDGTVAKAGIDSEAARTHWAFQPLRATHLPPVKDAAWGQAPLDRFILAKLEAVNLRPSPPADRRTLIRRATYDLHGLPPTAEEVEAFVNDQSPDAYEKLIDRLLASPRYGERWGRHWLDVARYADTKDGVLMYGDARIRPYAYTYRDYVLRAFNEDVPFDRFVHEQLAADLIEPKVEPWRLAALGFLTLGRMFDNNLHDVIDDRIDTVTRGFLGLTVACARCHDHKYDPIPTADYYSLYGVFASCEAPLELPLIEPAGTDPKAAEFEKKAAAKRKELRDLIEQQFALLSEQARQRVGDYLVRVATTEPDPLETAIFFLSLAPEDLRPQIVHRWRRHLAHPDRAADPVFGPWSDFMQLADADFAAQAQTVVERWRSKPPGQLNPLVRKALANAKLASKGDVARLYGGLLRRVYDKAKKQTERSLTPESRQLLEIVTGRDSPGYFPKSQTYYYLSRGEKDRHNGLKTQIDTLAVQSPHAPARAMVLFDAEEPYEPRVFHRGNPAAPTDRVPRQFLRSLAGDERKPFTHGSGRLDLARAITDHPLTARVLVNRVWLHHFGEPLVSTPSDFGLRSAPPTHPELLDFLAHSLKDDGWSLKKLHRRIMRSKTYQQTSRDRAECRAVDAENRLLWRQNRRRLDFEAMRDTLLAVAGRLDLTQGGRPVDVANDPNNRRRTVYGLVDRQSLPGVFRVFDFASPDQSAERRPLTTVPQQALFGLNAPFVVEQAKALAARTEGLDDARRVAALYRFVLARTPEPEEVRAGLRFVAAGVQGSQLTPWQQYAQVLLLTNEATFVD